MRSFVWVLAAALLSCSRDKPTERITAMRVDGPTGKVCKADPDCAKPCGPCTSGDVITQQMSTMECVVNPCPSAVGICSPQHICVVK